MARRVVFTENVSLFPDEYDAASTLDISPVVDPLLHPVGCVPGAPATAPDIAEFINKFCLVSSINNPLKTPLE
jgi:hypothetical protein